jgi:hypothetical protein
MKKPEIEIIRIKIGRGYFLFSLFKLNFLKDKSLACIYYKENYAVFYLFFIRLFGVEITTWRFFSLLYLGISLFLGYYYFLDKKIEYEIPFYVSVLFLIAQLFFFDDKKRAREKLLPNDDDKKIPLNP